MGKFLPDKDQPDEGVFAFQDDLDDQWLALRYDLTAPLARVVAETESLPKPFRRYQYGPVWRREIKPGKDRFRQFYQCDFDTVGCASSAADAEVCEVLATAMTELGINDFVVRVNNRKILNGLLESIQIDSEDVREDILRTLDKLDDIGVEGVAQQLGKGRRDQSGSFNEGLNLPEESIASVLDFLQTRESDRNATCESIMKQVSGSEVGQEGVQELQEMDGLLNVVGLSADRVKFDPSLVRGLSYYTGPVFEVELTFEIKVKGRKKKFGSVSGGGRYDYLVERFTGTKVPATGASIGVDRLLAALELLGKSGVDQTTGPVVICIMEKDRMPEYQTMVSELRAANIPAELYLGDKGMRAQLKYANKRNAPIAVVVGSDEFEKNEVTLKNMNLGAKLSSQIEDNETWRKEQPAQVQVARDHLVENVSRILSEQGLQ